MSDDQERNELLILLVKHFPAMIEDLKLFTVNALVGYKRAAESGLTARPAYFQEFSKHLDDIKYGVINKDSKFKPSKRLARSALTAPARFKEVSQKACNAELTAIHKQADELLKSLENMSSTASNQLFYIAKWHHPRSIEGGLEKQLRHLVEASKKANNVTEENSTKTEDGGADPLVVVKHLTAFLLVTWESEKNKKATRSTGKNEHLFVNFVLSVFDVLDIKASAERAVIDAIK